MHFSIKKFEIHRSRRLLRNAERSRESADSKRIPGAISHLRKLHNDNANDTNSITIIFMIITIDDLSLSIIIIIDQL